MPGAQQVNSTVTTATAPPITQPSFNVGCVVGYHQHYSDRQRSYTTPSALLADGFLSTEPIYRAAQIYFSQNPSPQRLVIGRRALPPTQVLDLLLTDSTSGDAYSFSVIGSDDQVHAISLVSTGVTTTDATSITAFFAATGGPVIQSGGFTLAGTVTVTNASASITFSTAQTLPAGTLLVFSAQPGVQYALASAVVASTSGTLSVVFGGTGGAGGTTQSFGPQGSAVSFTGTALANETIVVTITTGGTAAGGLARFSWSLNGTVQATGVTVAAGPLTLGTTGLSVNFGLGTYVVATTYTVVAIINCGTVSTSTSTVVFTQSAGKLTDIVGWQNGPVQNLQLTDATTDPGIAADLAAIYNANTLTWYSFGLDSNSKAEVLAAMAWAQGQPQGQTGKFFFCNNSDAADVNQAGISTTDAFATAQADTYGKTGCIYSGQEVLCYSGVSMMGYAMSQAPGRWVMADKSLPGCLTDNDTSLTLTQALVLNTDSASQPGTGGKNGNYYYQPNGQNQVWPGVCPSGLYIDYPIWVDYIDVQIQASVLAAKSAGPKLSYDANGLQVIYQAILGPLVAAATPDANGNVAVLMSSIVVTVPTLAQIAAASIANRDVPNASWSCHYVGGIQTVTANGVVYL
jgi:hypothetical protein